MPDGKKYYWLKLQRDFFKRHDIRIIEEMENGKDYLLFYLKLLVESIDHDGRLRFSDTIPYNERMLSVVTNTNLDIVRSALKVFMELKMIDVLEDETIYMIEVEKMIGSAADNDNARRQQRYRDSKKAEITALGDGALRKITGGVTNNNESKSIEIEKEIDKDNTPLNPPAEKKEKKNNIDLLDRILEGNPNALSDKTITVLHEWMEYKNQRKEYYVEKGMKTLLNQTYKMQSEYGSDAVEDCVRDSMASNYQGIIFDSLKKKGKKKSTFNNIESRNEEADYFKGLIDNE